MALTNLVILRMKPGGGTEIRTRYFNLAKVVPLGRGQHVPRLTIKWGTLAYSHPKCAGVSTSILFESMRYSSKALKRHEAILGNLQKPTEAPI